MKRPISFDVIGDGELREQVEEAIRKIAKDVVENPHQAGERSVSIKIGIKPMIQNFGPLGAPQNFPEVGFSVSTSFPGVKGMKTRGFVAMYATEQTVMFNTEDPGLEDHPDQMRIDEYHKTKEQGESHD